MQFFRNLFSSAPVRTEQSVINGVVTVFFDTNKQNFVSVQIEDKTTCAELLSANRKKIETKILTLYGDNDLTNFSFSLYNPSNQFSQLKLDASCRPLRLIIDTNNILLFTNKERKIKELTVNMSMAPSSSVKKKNQPIKYDFLYTGDIFKFSTKHNKLSKKKVGINENVFVITSSKKQPQPTVMINDIDKINYELTTASAEYQQHLKDDEKDFIIEIILKDGKLFALLRCRRQSDFNNWQSYFNEVIEKRNDKILDEKFSNEISSLLNGISGQYQSILEKCFTLNGLLELEDARRIFLNIISDRLFSDLIHTIIEYKKFHETNRFIDIWCSFKMMLNLLKADVPNGIEEDDKLKKIITQEKLSEIKKVAKDINDILGKLNADSNDYENDLNNSIKKVLSYTLFDELYDNIVKMVLTPIYEKYYSVDRVANAAKKKKNGVNTTSQVIEDNDCLSTITGSDEKEIKDGSIDKIMAHYFIKSSPFNVNNFSNLKREIKKS